MSNVEKLQEKLTEMGMRLGGVSRTPGSNASAEEVAAEVLRSLEAIQRGDYEECLMYDSQDLIDATGMTPEEIETDPELFKSRYRDLHKARSFFIKPSSP